MTQSRADIQKFVEGYFVKSGYFGTIGFGRNPIYLLERSGDIVPYYAPHVVYRRGRWSISGSVGYYCTKFEEKWRKLISKLRLSPQDTLMFSNYITNHQKFQHMPDIDILDSFQSEAFLESISSYILTMEKLSLSEFIYRIIDALLNENEARFWLGHPVKILTFLYWNSPEFASEAIGRLSSLTYAQARPYDKILPELLQ